MEDENITVKQQLEDKEYWDEPANWNVERDGVFIKKSLNYEKICLDVWECMQNDN